MLKHKCFHYKDQIFGANGQSIIKRREFSEANPRKCYSPIFQQICRRKEERDSAEAMAACQTINFIYEKLYKWPTNLQTFHKNLLYAVAQVIFSWPIQNNITGIPGMHTEYKQIRRELQNANKEGCIGRNSKFPGPGNPMKCAG